MNDVDNKITRSFDVDFFTALEYHLCRTFANSLQKDIKWLWCDGIIMPVEDQLRNKTLSASKRIVTEAWIGPNGQDKYEMTIKLGQHSFEACMLGLNLTDHLPKADRMDWITLDTLEKRIEVQLN